MLIVLVFNGAGMTQFAVTIDAQKDAFYEQLTGTVDGHIFIPHSDFLPLSGPKPDDDADLSAHVWVAWDEGYFYLTKTVEEMLMKGMPLGGPAACQYQQMETRLAPGDTVLLMSDGFPELFNDKDEMLDYPRIERIYQEAAVNSVDEIIRYLMAVGEKWKDGKPQKDDITFVVLKSR